MNSDELLLKSNQQDEKLKKLMSDIDSLLAISKIKITKREPYLKSYAKGLKYPILSGPQVAASLVQEFGETMAERPDLLLDQTLRIFGPIIPGGTGFLGMLNAKKLKAFVAERTDVDDYLTSKTKNVISANERYIKSRRLLPEMPNKINQFLFNLGAGTTSIAGAVGITFLTKSPHAAAVSFGVYQKGLMYQEAREAGVVPTKAGVLSTVAGGIEGGLEYIGLDILFKKFGGRLASIAIKSGTEALQEWSQETGENIVAKIGWDRSRNLTRGSWQAAAIGALLGLPTSVIIDTAQKNVPDLKTLPPQLQRNIIDKQKRAIADEAESIMYKDMDVDAQTRKNIEFVRSEDEVMRSYYSPDRKPPDTKVVSDFKNQPTIEKIDIPPVDEFSNYVSKTVDPQATLRMMTKIKRFLGIPTVFREKTHAFGGVKADRSFKHITSYLWDIRSPTTNVHEVWHAINLSMAKDKKIGFLFGINIDPARLLTLGKIDYKTVEQFNTSKVIESELNKASWYVRPKEGVLPGEPFEVGYTRGLFSKEGAKYRADADERLADFFTLFVLNPTKARELAPLTTRLFTENIATLPKVSRVMQMIFEKPLADVYEPPPSLQQHHALIDRLHDAFKSEIPQEGSDIEFSSHELKKVHWFGLPLWKFLTFREGRPVFQAVIKNLVRLPNRIESQLIRRFNVPQKVRLSDGARDRLSTAIYMGNSYTSQSYFAEKAKTTGKLGPQYYTADELRDFLHIIDNEELRAYYDIVAVLENIREYKLDEYRVRRGYYDEGIDAATRTAIDNEVTEMRNNFYHGWFPISRFGRFVVMALTEKGSTQKRPSSENRVFYQTDSKRDAIEMNNTLKDMGYKSVKVTTAKSMDALTGFKQLYQTLGIHQIENFLEAAGIDLDTTTDPDLRKLKEYFSLRTKGPHMMEREYVPGYKKDFRNVMDSLMDVISDTARRYGRARGMKEATRALGELTRMQKAAMKSGDREHARHLSMALQYAQDFYTKSFGAPGREFTLFRRFLFFNFLGWKLGASLQDGTQLITQTSTEVSKYVHGPAVEKVMTRAIGMGTQALISSVKNKALEMQNKKSPYKLSPDPIFDGILRRQQEEGVLAGQWTEQALGIRHPYRHKAEAIMGIMKIASEMIVRHDSSAAGYIIGKEVLKLKGEDLYDFCTDMIDKTQGLYSRYNMPLIVEGAGTMKGALKTLLIFNWWTTQYLHFFSQTMKGGTVESRVRAPLALITLGGVRALPFAVLLFALYRFLRHEDLETEVRFLVKQHPLVTDVMFEGLPALAGADVSALFGVGDIIVPERGLAEEFFGAGYGAINRYKKGISLMQKGELKRAIPWFLPSALANIFIARQWHRDKGVVDINGELIYDPTEYEAFLKTFGIMPLGLSKKYKSVSAVRLMTREAARRKDKYYDRLTNNLRTMQNALTAGDMKTYREQWEIRKQLFKDIQEYNRKADIEDRILLNPATLRARASGISVPGAEARALRYVPKIQRRKAKEIQELYRK